MSLFNSHIETGSIQVLVCTANIGNEPPNYESMAEWIPNDGETKSVLQNQNETPEDPSLETDNIDGANNFHIIAIGMQEATFEVPEEWSKSSIEQKKNNHDCHSDQNDTHFLHQMIRSILPSYTRAVSYQRGQMRLMIFHKNDLHFNLISVKAQNTGKGGRDNKGGIVAECDCEGTRLSFLTAHLEAHEGLEKYKTRCKTLSDIFGGTASHPMFDVSLTSHFAFAMGDLNFRTRLPNYEIGSEEHIQAAHRLAEEGDWDTLNKHDELALALRNKECLVGFSTPRCDFPPTFKIERTNGYVYKSQRSPSYTDRILYKAHHKLSEKIDLKAYGPIDRFTTSDHKPVRGAFEIQLNPKLRFQSHSPEQYHSPEDYQCFGVVPMSELWKNITDFGAKLIGHPDSFHFSCSSIECAIDKSALSDSSYTPSLFASFMTTPNDVIEAEHHTTSWMNFWGIDETLDPSTKFPHTEVIPNTLNARWEKQVEFMIKPYSNQLDLTGAMLHVVIHDTKDHSEPLGSCSLNLAALIMDSRGKKKSKTEAIEEPLTNNGMQVGSIKLTIDTFDLTRHTETAKTKSSGTRVFEQINSDTMGESLPTPQDLLPRIPVGHPDSMMSKESVRRAVEEFTTRPTDVIVATFPKTGTTLVTWICHLLRTNAAPIDSENNTFETLYEVVPWPTLSWDIGYDPNVQGSQFEPRVFKSHLRMASIYPGCKYVVTIRDPAKTTLSFYNFFLAKKVPFLIQEQANGETDIKMDVSTFLVETPFVKGSPQTPTSNLRASIWDYYAEYHVLLDCPSVLILVYEDFLTDKLAQISQLSKFLGISSDNDNLIETVASMSTKEFMAQHMSKFDEPYERAKALNRAADISQLAPGAKVALQTHKQSFDERATQFLDARWKETMEPLGYSDYPAFAAVVRERNQRLFGTTSEFREY